jgi:hypothetical protein
MFFLAVAVGRRQRCFFGISFSGLISSLMMAALEPSVVGAERGRALDLDLLSLHPFQILVFPA